MVFRLVTLQGGMFLYKGHFDKKKPYVADLLTFITTYNSENWSKLFPYEVKAI